MIEALKDFTEDVNNQQMSIHAYTLYVNRRPSRRRYMKCPKCNSKNLTSSCFGGYYETLYCKDCKYSWSVD